VSPATRLLKRLPRVATRIATDPFARLGVFALLALVATWPLLGTPEGINTFRDAHVLSHYESVARSSVVRWGQAPLWDPYYCGGMYLLGTPQARFASPTFLFTLIFGEARGEAVTAFVMLIVGLEGAFRYARSRRALAVGALLAAPAFGLSGVFALAPRLGWINFFGFALVPWIALGMRRALRGDVNGALLAAFAVAFSTGFGGTYSVPMVVVWCAFEVVEHLVRRRGKGALRALAMSLVVLSLSAGLSAFRLWPVAETLASAPRVIAGSPGQDYTTLGHMLATRLTEDGVDGQFFVGALVLPAALVALRRRSSLVLALYGWIWLWLSAGYTAVPSLFAATHALPVYGTLRYPERYLILFALVVATLAARGVTIASALARRRGRCRVGFRVVEVALVVCLLASLGPLVGQHIVSAALRDLAPLPLEIMRPFHQARGNRYELAYYEPMQRGCLSCWDAYPVPESPLLAGDLPEEESLEHPEAGTLKESAWSPNRIELDVALERATRVRVNQNWHRGWRTNVGEVSRERGLLVVDLPKGSHHVVLRFLPRSATGGLLVSVVTLLGALVLARRRAHLVLAGAALAPAFAFGAALLLISEPPPPPEGPLAPTGENIIVDSLPANATKLGTVFEDGVRLAGASIDASDAHPKDTLVLELDWVRGAELEPGLGVFVHLDSTKGGALTGDHVDLSQTLLFEAAPADKVLRDLLPITLPKDSANAEWTIGVGLWRVRRGGSRVRVVDHGEADVAGDEVRVAKFLVTERETAN
jgi:hypothetical protein